MIYEDLSSLGKRVVFDTAVDDVNGDGGGEEVLDFWASFGCFERERVFLVASGMALRALVEEL